MRHLPSILIALVAFIVGGVAGRLSVRTSGAVSQGGPAVAAKPAVKPAPKPASSAPPVVMVDGFQFEGMDFDTSPEFSHPSTVFPHPVKIYFRIRLKDMRTAPGTKKRVNLSYRRLGKTEKENGPLRQLTEEDLTHVGKTNEVIAFRNGLTFMASPPVGSTSFQVYVDSEPLAKSSFSVDAPKVKS